ARTPYADAGTIHLALANHPARGIGDIVLHLPAPLAVTGLDEAPPETTRTAEIDPEHRISVRSEDLHFFVVAPTIADSKRAAVRQHDERRRLVAGSQGEREIAMDLQAVPGLERHRLRAGKRGRVQPRLPARDERRLERTAIQQVAAARIAIAPDLDDDMLAILRAAAEGHRILGECGL